jgi:hypothetical protein
MHKLRRGQQQYYTDGAMDVWGGGEEAPFLNSTASKSNIAAQAIHTDGKEHEQEDRYSRRSSSKTTSS